jgi:hypothetical protein
MAPIPAPVSPPRAAPVCALLSQPPVNTELKLTATIVKIVTKLLAIFIPPSKLNASY